MINQWLRWKWSHVKFAVFVLLQSSKSPSATAPSSFSQRSSDFLKKLFLGILKNNNSKCVDRGLISQHWQDGFLHRKPTFVFPFKSAKRRKSPCDREENATSPLQISSLWRIWWFLWIWKMEMDVYSSTFLPKNSGSSQKQAEPPNASSCRRPARLSPCPHIHTLGKAQFFLSLATKQEKPTCSSLFLSDTYS